MKLSPFRTVAVGLIFLGGAIGCLQAQNSAGPDDWRPLFNGKNFDGWYTFLPSVGKNNDPNKVFKIEDGAIHVLDVAGTPPDMTGYLATNQEYGHVRVRLEYKFGTKRFGGRSEARRDAGLLYYFIGPDFVGGNNLRIADSGTRHGRLVDQWRRFRHESCHRSWGPHLGRRRRRSLHSQEHFFQGKSSRPASNGFRCRPDKSGNSANSQERRFSKIVRDGTQ